NGYLDVRLVLENLTRSDDRAKRSWEGFRRFESFHETICQILSGKGGKSVGALEARLRSLRVFIIAAMIADDYVFPSLGDELEKQLRGPMGMGTDQHHKIRDYLRDFGPDQFK